MQVVDGQYYIRVRGRILGPYDREKLQGLAKKGQFSKLHEVSTDGASWTRAGAYPELFVSDAAVGHNGHDSPTMQETAPLATASHSGARLAIEASPSQTAPGWYYTQGGAQAGPVDFSTLQSLAASGRLSGNDQVWTDGMAEWSAANRVAGLNLAPTPTSSLGKIQPEMVSDNVGKSDQVSGEACRALTASRPWILFISIILFIYAAISAIGGVLLIVVAGHDPRLSAMLISQALFAFLSAGVQGVGAFLLLSYSGRIKELQFRRTMTTLEATLNAGRAFWVYTGIVLLVFLALAIIFGIWIFAMAGTIGSSLH